MSRLVLIGALAPLVAFGTPARADWRSPITGAKPILPTKFTPQKYVIGTLTITPAPPATLAVPAPVLPAPASPAPALPTSAGTLGWSLPLLDRRLSAEEKAADIAPELQDAIARVEPLYDPTRLDGPDAPAGLVISAGTAFMANVFADRWRRADTDPNVNAKTSYIAIAWTNPGPRPCDAFVKARRHSFGDPALTALDAEDCRALEAQTRRGVDNEAASPIVAATLDVPVFAAPLPGSRLSSQDFWAGRRAQIAEIQAHLQRKWEAGAPARQEIGAR